MENLTPEGPNQVLNTDKETAKHVALPHIELDNLHAEVEGLIPGASRVGSETTLTPGADLKVVLPDEPSANKPQRALHGLLKFMKKREEQQHGLQRAA